MSRRVIITGGGTGGHIFPAISIANELRKTDAAIEILFVGAEGGMEMRVVPEYGYRIEGVNITGIMRSLSPKNVLKNLAFPFRLLGSMIKSGRIIKSFKPDVVVGVGGYASGPVGRVAAKRKIPVVLCEQNAYPGITNKWLAPKAALILLGNEAAAKYFDASKTKITGNPVRETLLSGDRAKGLEAFALDGSRPVVLSLGGSLGAGTLNNAWENGHKKLTDAGIQLVWQCGKRYHEALSTRITANENLRIAPFIEDMASAYAAADLIVTRAGGSTISELILLNKPAVLIPSPNVAEDHQTKNALSLSERGAAVLLPDNEASEKLADMVLDILQHPEKIEALRNGIEKIEKHNAAKEIASEILSLMNGKGRQH